MATLSRWLAPVVLAAGIGAAALSPTVAHAQSGDDLARVIVNIADVVLRGNTPYYRYGDYSYDDRLVAGRDRYGRTVYYRMVPRGGSNGAPYGNAYGYYRNQQSNGYAKCNKHGKCKTQYYDARYDSGRGPRYDNRYDNRYYSYDRRDRDDGRRDDHGDDD